MALKATIFKADLQIIDTDRHYYQSHALTLARHPSETDERMMIRLLAFARHASETLAFTKGLSATDEPDIWQKNLTGEIELWIEIGQPEDKRIRQACGRARQVIIYCYGGGGASLWWNQLSSQVKRLENLSVYYIPSATSQALADLTQRTMQLQCSIQDGQTTVTDHTASVEVVLEKWLPAER